MLLFHSENLDMKEISMTTELLDFLAYDKTEYI